MTAKAVAEQCDITVAMLADPAAAEAVALGPDGIAEGMKEGVLASDPTIRATIAPAGACLDMLNIWQVLHAGKGYLDVSTVDAGTAQKIAQVQD